MRGNQLRPVYHEDHGVRTLKELGRSYLTITKDLTRVMSQIKGVYAVGRSPALAPPFMLPGIATSGWPRFSQPGVRLRAERFYQELDLLRPLHQQARCDLVEESRRHPAVKLLRQIPSIGAIRGALLVAVLQTSHRFRTKGQLCAYSGFAVETHGQR